VNQSQQRFYAHQGDQWPIRLLLFKTRFTARDALFGFPIGSGIRLENPDDTEQLIPFASESSVTVHALVRGIYHVSVTGAAGLAQVSPVAQSRDQEVRLLVVSYLDLGIVIMVLAAIGFGLLFTGRPQLFFALGNPHSLLAITFQAIRQIPVRVHDTLKQPLRRPSYALPEQLVERAIVELPQPEQMHTAQVSRREPTLLFAVGLIVLGLISGIVGLDLGTSNTSAMATMLVRTGLSEVAPTLGRALAVLALGLVAVCMRWRPGRTKAIRTEPDVLQPIWWKHLHARHIPPVAHEMHKKTKTQRRKDAKTQAVLNMSRNSRRRLHHSLFDIRVVLVVACVVLLGLGMVRLLPTRTHTRLGEGRKGNF
jgi:hypothetical protein